MMTRDGGPSALRRGRRGRRLRAGVILALAAGSLGAQEAPPEEFPEFGEAAELVVNAPPDTPSPVKVISREEIERIAAPDLPTLLEEALDINITRHGAYGNATDVNLRGFDTERIAILVDGVPVNSALSGDFDFNTLNMGAIERIEVIYGGSDSTYNVTGALGGVINIITIKDRDPGFHLGAGFSSTAYMPGPYTEWDGASRSPQWQDLGDSQKLDFTLSYGAPPKAADVDALKLGAGEADTDDRNGDLDLDDADAAGSGAFSASISAFGNRAGNHYRYKDSFLGQVRRKQYNEVLDAGGGALAAWNFPDLSSLILKIDAYYSDKQIPATGFSSVIGVQNDITLREALSFEAPVFLREDLSVEASVSHSWARMDYDREGMPFSRHDQQGLALINRWGWYPLSALTLRVGWDYRVIRLDSTGVGDRVRQDGGLSVAAEYTPLRGLRVIPSIKAVSDGGDIVPAPKLGFVWEALPALTLTHNYFRSFKFPDFEDLYWAGGGGRGNPDLKPEDGWGVDLSGELQAGEFLNGEAALFAQYTKDSIHWHKAASGYWEPENIGEAALFGADLRLKLTLPVSWGPVKQLRPSLSYQYLLSRLLSYGYRWEDARRIPYQPDHTLGAAVDVSWGTGSARLWAHYESVRYYTVTNMIELAPYLLVNLSVSQTLGKLTVFGALRNLLNQSYESYNRYPMPAFNVTAGMRLAL